MNTLELKKDLHWVGALDPNLKVFDIVMYTEFGTTYNSYVLKCTEGTVLFETVKVKYFDDFIEKLKNITPLEDIKYLVLNHTEPDHSGSVEKLLELIPNLKVIGSKSALNFLKQIANKDLDSIIATPNAPINLGDKTLQFISAPFLHWPDSIYTYVKEINTLITCDSFGSHYCFDEILSSKVVNHDDYNKALRYYYDMIMGPFKPHVLKAIAKIEDLDFDMICPGHGPVLDKDSRKIVEHYREWSTEVNPNTKKCVVIPYVSAYGYTELVAKQLAKGIEVNEGIEVLTYDMVDADKDEVLSKIRWADGVLFGSPTINSDALPPIWDLLMAMSPIVHAKKLAASFGSYGWSGEAVPNIDGRLKSLKLKIFAPGYKVNFKPSDTELEKALQYGKEFGETILGNIKTNSFSVNLPKK